MTIEHVPGQLTLDDARPRPRALSLFSGYGGLDLAVAGLLGAEVIAHAEYEPPTKSNPNPGQEAARLLAHRYPHVPNLGDVSKIDWSTVGPVDVITGGFPCQDVSLAGRRLGIRHDTRSGLWGHMAAAVDELRPSLVVIENVRGLLSARAHHPAHSDVEPCPWCLAGPDDVSLRALGAVLGDLSDLGYNAAWRLLSASDVGAPHGRARVFVIAWPSADTCDGPGQLERACAESGPRGGADPDAAGGGCGAARGDDRLRAARLVPVGVAADAADVGHERGRRTRGWRPGSADDRAIDWGPYTAAIRRWAAVLGRPAPPPTETSARGGQRLSPRFVEWLMGLPAGWVTDVPGISRNDALRLLGNGCVPQQAAVAVGQLLDQAGAVTDRQASTSRSWARSAR